MISFEIPEKIKQELQMLEMVAKTTMRPAARDVDEDEQEALPEQFIKTMWPVMQGVTKGTVKRAQAQIDGEEAKKSEGPSIAYTRMLHQIEMLSWGDEGIYLSIPGPMLGGTAVEAAGTPEQKVRFLGKFTEGGPRWGSMAMTEPDAGSDTSAIATTAVLDEETNEWVLNGEKIFCTGGKRSLLDSEGFVVVWATIDKEAGRGGMKSFVIEAGAPGLEVTKVEHKLGIRASDTVSILMKDCRVPYENILGSPEVRKKDGNTKGFKGAMKTFDASRPTVAAMAVGVARAAVDFVREALDEAGYEIRYDAPPYEQTVIERDFIWMEGQLRASWLLTLRAAAMMDEREPNALESSMCKTKAGEAATEITQKAVELLGPMGYSREWLVEKWMRDAKINDIFEGTHQINQLIVARNILGYSGADLR
jgi:acyl-CoA dehydrogenase